MPCGLTETFRQGGQLRKNRKPSSNAEVRKSGRGTVRIEATLPKAAQVSGSEGSRQYMVVTVGKNPKIKNIVPIGSLELEPVYILD